MKAYGQHRVRGAIVIYLVSPGIDIKCFAATCVQWISSLKVILRYLFAMDITVETNLAIEIVLQQKFSMDLIIMAVKAGAALVLLLLTKALTSSMAVLS